MTCPYCNQPAYDQAKFCAGCGLPLKSENISFAGIPLSEDGNMRPWMIAAGAACVLFLAAGITMFRPQTSQRDRQSSSRGPQGGYIMPPPVPTGMAAQPLPSVAPSANYNPNVRWAFNPAPPPVLPAINAADLVEPAAPPVLLASLGPVFHRPAYVESVSPTYPDLPEQPADVQAAMQQLEAYRTGFTSGDYGSVPLGQLNGFMGVGGENAVPELGMGYGSSTGGGSSRQVSSWVWDPVHERWAYRTERIQRSSSERVRSGAARQ